MHWIQPPIPPTPPTHSLKGETIIVTGANTGLGFEAARQLLQLGASTLVLAVRNTAKGLSAKHVLLADPLVRCINPPPALLVYELDLSSHDSVITFVRKVVNDLPVLNVLILNGGTNLASWTVSPETQNEMVFQVNFLSNALLSILLLPFLRCSAKICGLPSRITFLGSQGQEFNVLSDMPVPTATSFFHYLNDPLVCSAWKRYSDSKLLVTMWVTELALRLDPSEVTVNVLCPGIVHTRINSNYPLWMRAIMFFVMMAFRRSLDEGGRTLVYAATIAGEETHGQMLVNNDISEPLPFFSTIKGVRMGQMLWDETLELASKLSMWQLIFGTDVPILVAVKHCLGSV